MTNESKNAQASGQAAVQPRVMQALADLYALVSRSVPVPDSEYHIVTAAAAVLGTDAPAAVQEKAAPSDPDILALAAHPMYCPCPPWWLKDEVKFGDVRQRAIAFARALLARYGQPALSEQDRQDIETGRKWRENSSLDEWFPLTAENLASTKRMFQAAVSDLAAISERLGMDPDDAGADAFIAAIDDLAQPAASAQPVAWAAVHFGGRRDGNIYNTCDTREQIEAYIQDVHRSSDSLTLRARPLAFADAPVAAQAPRPCTCHPDDRPRGPCREKYAASECQAPAADGDALDAARYRWLRTGDGEVWCGSGDDLLTGDDLDAAIDAARAAGGEHGN